MANKKRNRNKVEEWTIVRSIDANEYLKIITIITTITVRKGQLTKT